MRYMNNFAAPARSRMLAGMRGAQDSFSIAATLNQAADAISGLVDPSVTDAIQGAAQDALYVGAAQQSVTGYNPPGVTTVRPHHLILAAVALAALAYFYTKRRRR